jgi:hypothetical protein
LHLLVATDDPIGAWEVRDLEQALVGEDRIVVPEERVSIVVGGHCGTAPLPTELK